MNLKQAKTEANAPVTDKNKSYLILEASPYDLKDPTINVPNMIVKMFIEKIVMNYLVLRYFRILQNFTDGWDLFGSLHLLDTFEEDLESRALRGSLSSTTIATTFSANLELS